MGSSVSISSLFLSPEFNPGPIIGYGAYAKIREVYRSKDDQIFALKEFEIALLKPKDAQVIKNELTILRKLSPYPFIVDLYRSFREKYTISFVMEFLSGGDLRLAIRSRRQFTEYEISYLMACIGSGLNYLHNQLIIHRDIKPDNIVLTANGVPKLVDFGVSCCLTSPYSPELFTTSGGTQQYFAPEALVPEVHYQGYESDFWSLGITMYELLFLQRPFENVPLSMIVYSQESYQTSWKMLLTGNKERIHPTTMTVNSCLTNEVNCFQLTSESINLRIHQEILHQSLLIQLPDQLDHRVILSQSCRDLLLSLLDVRIHIRLGGRDRFPLFQKHTFFSKLNHAELVTMNSPITVNTQSVSQKLSSKFDEDNFLDQVSTHAKRLSTEEMKILNNILGDLTYTTPHFPQLFPLVTEM